MSPNTRPPCVRPIHIHGGLVGAISNPHTPANGILLVPNEVEGSVSSTLRSGKGLKPASYSTTLQIIMENAMALPEVQVWGSAFLVERVICEHRRVEGSDDS